jgi:hypothetical protein
VFRCEDWTSQPYKTREAAQAAADRIKECKRSHEVVQDD